MLVAIDEEDRQKLWRLIAKEPVPGLDTLHERVEKFFEGDVQARKEWEELLTRIFDERPPMDLLIAIVAFVGGAICEERERRMHIDIRIPRTVTGETIH